MTPPTPQALSLAMSMIDRRMWRVPGQVVDLVRMVTIDAPDLRRFDYRQLSDRDAAEWLFDSPKRHRRSAQIFKNLVSDGVLEVLEGAGSRPNAWRIEGDFRRWQVPWNVPKSLAMMRLDHFFVPLDSAQIEPRAEALTSALKNLLPSSLSRHKKSPMPSYATRHKPNPLAEVRNSAQTSANGRSHLSLDSSKELSVYEQPASQEDVQKVVEAIKRQTGCQDVYGSLLIDVRQLVRHYGADMICTHAPKAPKQLGAPQTVRWLASELEGGSLGAPASPASERERLEKLAASCDDPGDREYFLEQLTALEA